MNHTQCSLMIIDDCLEDRETYRRYLLQDEQYSYQIWEEEYGEEALNWCRTNQPDLILLDYMLADTDGLNLLQDLQAALASKCPPVIILTGQGSEALAVEAMKQGAEDYLVKQNITSESLRFVVHNVLERSWLRRQLAEKEKELQSKQRLLEQINIATPDLLYLYDLEKQQQTYVNNQITQVLGYSLEEIQQIEPKSLFCELMHPEDLVRVSNWIKKLKLAKDGEVLEFEYRLRHANQEWRWINNRNTVFSRNLDGSVQQVLGIARDITERRKIEEALHKSESRFRRLVESNIIGVMIAHFQGNLSYANDAFLEILGYEKEELLNEKMDWRKLTPKEYSFVDEQALEELKKLGICTPYEKEYIRRDGSRVHVLIGSARLEEEEDKAIAFVVNLSDRKQMEAERALLLEESKKANQAKDLFLSIVSHELRNPLNAILGYSYLLRKGNLNESNTERAWEVIERSVKMQSQMIDDLLDISRINSGKLHLNNKKIDLILAIEAAIDTVRLMAQAKEITIEATFELSAKWVWGDISRLQQIIVNLLSNAIKFTPSEGHIQVSHKRIGDWVEVAVKDTGQGISPEFLPHVFERFWQGKQVDKHMGLGLGLAIVHHLVELHGGTVWAESPGEGQGSVFTFRLPLLTI